MTGNFGLIDNDTPDDVKTKTGYTYGETYELVFSDEFNQDGRTFYPGDDPYWYILPAPKLFLYLPPFAGRPSTCITGV